MKKDLSQSAVMTLNEGEELVAGRTTALIPQVGRYKLLAKKKADGSIEWAHFVEREDGRKEKVIRGTVPSADAFEIVIAAINSNLSKVFGVITQPADYDVRTLDGQVISGTIH
jgi:hypothetical protein